MSHFSDLQNELSTYLDDEKITIIHTAYQLAAKAHKGQHRYSGDPYIIHPIAVAAILCQMQMDYQSIAAAILHDVIEDTPIEKTQIVETFGAEIADLVDGVSKLTHIPFENQAQAQAENFRKMTLAMARDIRVILIKLADRLHNMRTLGPMPSDKKNRIARETLDIYAPIASRLGMHNFSTELEDLCFATLYPLRFRALQEAVRKSNHNRKQTISHIETGIKTLLEQMDLPPCAVWHRHTHLYGIYRRMRNQRLHFQDVTDGLDFRIVTDSTDTCYRVLGAIHKLYKPLPEHFKDYIALPKANGYQALHTALFGPHGMPINIQIRTVDMDNVSENGIAAFGFYKRGENLNEAKTRASQWLKGLMEIQKNTPSSLEFLENVKTDLFPAEIYIFTPRGKIMELPRRATPIDFAYAVHSDIGNSCIAAKVDRRFAPLSTVLLNGQTVEIMTSPEARPQRSWLNFVETGKARSNIRHYLKEKKHADAVLLDKELLEKTTQEPYAIKGSQGMAVKFAECCRPIPGDAIAGVFMPTKGLTAHQEACKKLDKWRHRSGRYIELNWAEQIADDFKVDLTIEITNRPGIIADIATRITRTKANIDDIQMHHQDNYHGIIHLLLSVHDRVHLATVIRRIRSIRGVTKISRAKPIY